jgi:hypothetical protein
MRPVLAATLLLPATRAVSPAGTGHEAATRAADLPSDAAGIAAGRTARRAGEVRAVQVALEERG